VGVCGGVCGVCVGECGVWCGVLVCVCGGRERKTSMSIHVQQMHVIPRYVFRQQKNASYFLLLQIFILLLLIAMKTNRYKNKDEKVILLSEKKYFVGDQDLLAIVKWVCSLLSPLPRRGIASRVSPLP
jgi:hypothetical protein